MPPAPFPTASWRSSAWCVQPDGQFKVWCSKWNGTTNQFGTASVILSSTATSAFTAFVPAQFGTG